MTSINFKLQAFEYNLYMSKLQTKIFFMYFLPASLGGVCLNLRDLPQTSP